jgi:hypothetical protein
MGIRACTPAIQNPSRTEEGRDILLKCFLKISAALPTF